MEKSSIYESSSVQDDDEALSPIIATILMVAIIAIFATILYLLIQGDLTNQDSIRFIGGLIVLVFLFFFPGFFLVLLIFPRRGQLSKDYDFFFKIVLSFGCSIIMTIIIAVGLDYVGLLNSTSEIKYLSLWIILGIVTFWLGIISWRWGGLQDFILSLGFFGSESKESFENEMMRLVFEKKKLQDKLILLENKDYQIDEALKEEATVRIPAIKKRIEEINNRIDNIISQKESIKEIKP